MLHLIDVMFDVSTLEDGDYHEDVLNLVEVRLYLVY